MKVCSTCGLEKSRTDFYKRADAPDGLRKDCKACVNTTTKAWRARNTEKVREYGCAYLKRHPDRVKENTARAYKKQREKCPEKLQAAYTRWWLENKEKAAEATKRWLDANPDRKEVYKQRAREKKAWRNADPARARAKCVAYQARKKKAAPPWLTKEHRAQILYFYKEALRLEQETGVKHHVDHIFPLKGKNFSGLHVPWNLRVIPAVENISKLNKVLPSELTGMEVFS